LLMFVQSNNLYFHNILKAYLWIGLKSFRLFSFEARWQVWLVQHWRGWSVLLSYTTRKV
jgi:hypothetical protein